MLDSISLGMLLEWAAFESIDPSSEQRSDVRAAMVACTVANSLRGKNSRRYTLDDFMPRYDQEKRRQTPEQMKAVAMAYVENFRRIQAEKQCRQQQT